MPLLRGMARTAVIAGTATTVSNRVSRRQANKWAQQDAEQAPPQQQYAPPPEAAPAPAAPTESRVDKLTQLAAAEGAGRAHRRGVRRREGAHPPELTFPRARAPSAPALSRPARGVIVWARAGFRRRTTRPGRTGCAARTTAVPTGIDGHPASLTPRRASAGVVVVIAALGAALAAGAVVDRAARGHAGPRLARAAQRARRRPADRRRALRLARGDPRAVRPPARPRRLPVGGRRPCRVVRAAAVQHRARRGLDLGGGDRLPPAGLPVRAAPGPRRPGARPGGGPADRAALRPDGVARRRVPGAVDLGHLQRGLPRERAQPRRRDARVGQRRGDPGARGALDPAPAARPLAARGPAVPRDAADAARACAGPRRGDAADVHARRVDRRAPRRRRRRRRGVADRRAVAHAAARVARVPRRAAGLAALHRRRAARARAPAARRAGRGGAPRRHGPGGEGPLARPRVRPPGRPRLGHRGGLAGGAARARVRPRGDVHQPTTRVRSPRSSTTGRCASSGRSSRPSARTPSSGTRTSGSPSASTARAASCGPRGRGSSPRPTTSAGGSSATCTTAASSGWSRCGSGSSSPRR